MAVTKICKKCKNIIPYLGLHNRQIAVEETNYNANNILHVPYLGLYNAQDFAQILYL
jgi:hypothetical protein